MSARGADTVRKRLRKADRRRLIEDAAAEQFAARGYGDAKLADIAADAGVTKQLLYQHFSSKQELYLALLARHRDGLLGRLAAGMSRPASLEERVQQTMEGWFAYFEENPAAAALLFRDPGAGKEVRVMLDENHATARGLMVALVRAEPSLEIRDELLEPLAEYLRSAGGGLALWWADHPEAPRSLVVEAAVTVLLGGLREASGS